MRTDHFIRFEHVDSVEEAEHGLLARLHGELLRIDAVRPDVVRLQLSRGGVFDPKPTYAVCVDPIAAPRRAGDVAESRRSDGQDAWRARHGRARRDRCGSTRSASTCTAPTARSSSSRRRTPRAATGRTRRSTTRGRRGARIGRDDAIYGLGEKGGRHNRRGRDFTMWNTDVLNEHATAEFRAGLSRPTRGPT